MRHLAVPDDPPQPVDRRLAGRTGGSAAVLLGAAAWGSTGTAAHFAPVDASSASIGAARIALGGLVLLAFALRTAPRRRAVRRLLTGDAGSCSALVVAAAAVAGYQVCFFTAVRMTGVAVGTVVAIGSAPVLTGALSRLAGGPRLDARWMAATVAAVAGCAVLVTGGQGGDASAGGVGLALAAGLCYAIYAVTASRLITAGSPEDAVMGLLFGGAAVLLAPVLAAGPAGWLLSARGLAVTAYLGIVTTALAYLLYGRGLRTVSAPVAVTLGLAEPVVAAVLGLVVLGERLTATEIVGLALVGLALASLVGARAPVAPPSSLPG